MRDILIKIVSKEQYADELLNGTLFMHSSRYYRKLEEEGKSGQGDLGEGLILPNKCIYQCPDYAIFCLCFIDGSTIIDGIVEINEKLVNDFMHENGYIVCIDFNRFILSLKRCDVKMIHDKVKYGFCSYFSIEPYNLLFKRPHFSYQSEYRIIIYENISDINKPCAYKKYHIPGGINDFSKKYSIDSLERKSSGKYILDINDFLEDVR